MNEEIKEKIMMMGSRGVGKSSILYKYLSGTFTETIEPTIGFKIFCLILIIIGIEFRLKKINYKSHKIKLEIWDPTCEEQNQIAAKFFCKGIIGAIIFFDLTKSNSFEEKIDHYLVELKNNSNKEDNLIIVLVGNKIDLCIDDPKSRQVTRDEIDKKIEAINKEYGIKINYFESSAKTGTNINEIFEVFFEELKKKCENEEINKPSIILDSKNQEKKNKCFN